MHCLIKSCILWNFKTTVISILTTSKALNCLIWSTSLTTSTPSLGHPKNQRSLFQNHLFYFFPRQLTKWHHHELKENINTEIITEVVSLDRRQPPIFTMLQFLIEMIAIDPLLFKSYRCSESFGTVFIMSKHITPFVHQGH